MQLHYLVAINIISKVNGKKEDSPKPNHIKIAKPLVGKADYPTERLEDIFLR